MRSKTLTVPIRSPTSYKARTWFHSSLTRPQSSNLKPKGSECTPDGVGHNDRSLCGARPTLPPCKTTRYPLIAATDFAGPTDNCSRRARIPLQMAGLSSLATLDFASDLYFDQYGNGDLFIKTVDWAAGQGNIINLTSAQIRQSGKCACPINPFTILLLAFVFVEPGSRD